MDGLELTSDCTSFRSGMMQPRVPESESTVLRISNSGGVCRGGVGQVQRKETAHVQNPVFEKLKKLSYLS